MLVSSPYGSTTILDAVIERIQNELTVRPTDE
jgi:hypothetical protein